ncbi:MAG: hypothetical protein ACE5I7_07320 [Candidatus Binatia bacterium]
MRRFLGITRERVYSPGRVGDDGAILGTVAAHLRQLGHIVEVMRGDEDRWPQPAPGTVIFAMCQGPHALARLRQWQGRGVRIINAPEAILSCQRHRAVAALTRAGIPVPESLLVETGSRPVMPSWVDEDGAWVKRGDVHATETDDVVFADCAAAAGSALQRLQERRIGTAVVQRHIPGRLLKFYAVRDLFFRCIPSGGAIAASTLRRVEELGQRAAQVLKVEVYGGDCISNVNGRLTLIDFNDWPSYAPCRAEAAKEIAAYLLAHNVASET